MFNSETEAPANMHACYEGVICHWLFSSETKVKVNSRGASRLELLPAGVDLLVY